MVKSNRRMDIRAILRNPRKRQQMMVEAIIATQAREGIITTRAQAVRAYKKVQKERRLKAGLTNIVQFDTMDKKG